MCVEAYEQLTAEGISSPRRQHAVVGALRGSAGRVSRGGSAAAVNARVAVEQASTLGWDRYVGRTGRVIGMQTFGASAPLKELQKKFGFQPELVAAAAREQLGRKA